MNNRTASVYGLRVIGEETFKYVGQTVRPLHLRLHGHRSCSRRDDSPVAVWMRSVGCDLIEIVELEVCSYSDRLVREDYWTLKLGTLLRENGFNRRLSTDPLSETHVMAARAGNLRFVSTPEGALYRRRSGQFGMHQRWHANRGIVKDDCEFCAHLAS